MIEKLVQTMVMFFTGGIVYFYFEILVRGYSHLSMFFLGGICFYCVGKIGTRILSINKPIIFRLVIIMVAASVVITSLELATGLFVNSYLKLSVWDYSQMKYNYMGQICLLYSFLWSLLGLPCVYFYGIIDRFILEDGRTENA